MGFWSKLFGEKYNDTELEAHVRTAINADPLIKDASMINISCQKGVIKLSGKVSRVEDKDRLEGIVRSALRNAGLKYQSIVNEVNVAQPA
ncbi:BON domain-containing protein [Litorilinea aerophila]|uniref:BON domain-containing protein n=1 Tax=Litorilinea aerophila TaxID=1204385 RepID=A0A540VLL0_9CHLR|nr:BON domain-containing protein [Litorilinea aerophila]MCC9074806.1 BON domain-containing protein [Litorilinea aerophila]OUC08645.1 hypothetical protein RY27_07745 [Litorilinea aerophila]GIV77870.1 MAG: hypothetical protein KatS3mg050_2264 [Litorilinea sp.]